MFEKIQYHFSIKIYILSFTLTSMRDFYLIQSTRLLFYNIMKGFDLITGLSHKMLFEFQLRCSEIGIIILTQCSMSGIRNTCMSLIK